MLDQGPVATRYWERTLETLDRAQLEKLQLRRLRTTVRRLAANVSIYQEKFAANGFNLRRLRSLEDVHRLPFTTAEDLRASYPRGLLAVAPSEVLRLHTSSGTTGKPKALMFSRRDVDHAANLMARCLVMSGVTQADILQNMMTYGLFTGALVMQYGAEKVGVMVIPAGPGHSEKQWLLMRDFGTTLLHLTPSYALYLVDFLEQHGVDPRRDLAIRKAFIGAEPYTEATRAKIERGLGVEVYNSYGLSEMNGPGVAFECQYRQGTHLWEDNYLMEIVDPQTGDPLPEGHRGELVLTTLRREAMPLVRFRTRDITAIIPEPCRCGRTHRRLERVTGRTDDMLIVRGVNIYPQQIERVLMSQTGLGRNYVIELAGLDEMTVKVELANGGFDGQVEHLVALQHRVVDQLRAELLVKPKVELVPPGTLPASEGKARRVIDQRVL